MYTKRERASLSPYSLSIEQQTQKADKTPHAKARDAGNRAKASLLQDCLRAQKRFAFFCCSFDSLTLFITHCKSVSARAAATRHNQTLMSASTAASALESGHRAFPRRR